MQIKKLFNFVNLSILLPVSTTLFINSFLIYNFTSNKYLLKKHIFTYYNNNIHKKSRKLNVCDTKKIGHKYSLKYA